MDVSLGSAISSMQQSSLQQQVGNQVLRKALDIQEQSAQQLIQALPQQAAAPTGQVGQNLDVHA